MTGQKLYTKSYKRTQILRIPPDTLDVRFKHNIIRTHLGTFTWIKWLYYTIRPVNHYAFSTLCIFIHYSWIYF